MLLQNQPTLEEVFGSIRQSVRGGNEDPTRLLAGLGLILALALILFAIRHWHRAREPAKPLNHRGKLLSEASKLAGIPKQHLKQLAPLAEAAGLSSPLVAIICPTVLKLLAGKAQTETQRQAILALAQKMARGAKR